jgi:transcriptional regulator with GAF, ATPase, and Fis domain
VDPDLYKKREKGPGIPIYGHEARDDGEAARLAEALETAAGNAAKAARSLNISPQLMNYKINKYGLKRDKNGH